MIEIKQLSRSHGDTVALWQVSAKLVNGRIYGILGPEGAGKTTLLDIMAGVLSPEKGAVKINGLDLWEKPQEVKAQLAYLPARPPLYEDMTPTEYLTFVAHARGVAAERVGGQVRLALETAELEDVAHRLIRRLTQAQACRLGLAQLMPGSPELLLIDQPEATMTPKEEDIFWTVLQKVADGKTVLLASRDKATLCELCDEVLVLSEGSFVTRGTPEEIAAMPELFDIVHKAHADDEDYDDETDDEDYDDGSDADTEDEEEDEE